MSNLDKDLKDAVEQAKNEVSTAEDSAVHARNRLVGFLKNNKKDIVIGLVALAAVLLALVVR